MVLSIHKITNLFRSLHSAIRPKKQKMESREIEVIIFTVLYAITMLLAFAGNMLLIYIVWKKPEVRSLTSFMFVNMAVADLLVTLIVMPVSIAHLHTGGKWLIPGMLGEITCRAFLFLSFVTITASILCLTCMAIDRYYAVVYPFRRHLWFRKPKILTPLVWFLSTTFMSIAPVIQNLDVETSYCKYDFSILGDKTKSTRGVFVYFFAIGYLIPLSVTSILYARTARTLWFQSAPGNILVQNREQQESTKRRVVRMLIIVLTVFALCWLPGQVYHLFVAVTVFKANWPPVVMNACFWFGHANSAINPWLYILLSRKFHTAFKRMLSKKLIKAHSGSTMEGVEVLTPIEMAETNV